MTDNTGSDRYAELRHRFNTDRAFRDELRSSESVEVVQSVLGELTDEETAWINDLPHDDISDEELLKMIKLQKMAW